MTVIKRKLFDKHLENILIFIAKDSTIQAKKFKNGLRVKINNLITSPYKFRESFYYDNQDTRDMIFKGYTIPYLIEKEHIVILDIFKWINK